MADEQDGGEARARPAKSPKAFRTISEVADELGVPQHVLRFWESRFSHLRPLKRGGGRRYYRPEDVALLRRIRALLYDDGYTIKGVQKLLRESVRGQRESEAPPRPADAEPNEPAPVAAMVASDARVRRLGELAAELAAIRDALRAHG